MPKEWILNSAINRFQLNFKRNVGATSESIRQCAPKSVEQWRDYYFANVRDKAHIVELGKKLHIKISETLSKEIEQISEQDCIDYMLALVIDRTFDGYMREIKTVYGLLEAALGRKIEPAPDKWDRLYNVDFYIEVGKKFIGLQIKPVASGVQLPQVFKERGLQEKTHKAFEKKHGGRVFYIFSESKGGKKTIQNTEALDEIRAEIKRLGA